jgi:amidohydrolase
MRKKELGDIKKFLDDEVKLVLGRVIDIRRHLHAHPELSFQELETSRFIASLLEDAGVEVKRGLATTGVVGHVRGAKSGRTIALRADMDALPVTEVTGLSFVSRIPGVMHACHHDGHMAMLLGAAMILVRMRERLEGNVKFIFQPGEEGYAGARKMIEEGVLEDEPRIQAAFALHLDALSPSGTLSTRPGPIMACADIFSISIIGKGGHAAMPHRSVDPILVAGHIVTALQSIASRKTDPVESIVVSVCTIHAGTAMTVIPDRVEMGGTVRLFDPGLRDQIPALMEEIIRGVAAAFGASYEFNYARGYPATINDPEFAAMVLDCGKKLLGQQNVHTLTRPRMPSEDFSFFLEKVPGAFAILGARPRDREPLPSHNPATTIDETALETGVKIHAAVALAYLGTVPLKGIC